MIIELEKWEYEHAVYIAGRRLAENKGRKDAAHYNNNLKQNEILANVATCCCEIAVAKLFNEYWHAHVWDVRDHSKYKDLPDVGKDIEVRRIREKENPVTVRKNDVLKNRIVVAAYAEPPEFWTVNVLGMIEAGPGWEIGAPASFDPENSRRVSISDIV